MNTTSTLESDFPKAYVAHEHEAALYALWENNGTFAPSTDQSKPAFSVVMPPPNANGNLHLGHALEASMTDALVRYHRLKGDRTIYVPGADHAGIETQTVFEKALEKEGRSRFQMTREQFYEETNMFVQGFRGNMESQIRVLGSSVDWSVNRFTLDPAVIERAYETFRKLYADGLVYRGERIVNYSVKYRTAYSDLEVEHEERTEPLYFIKYGPITVATVRPETKFGDKVIVVHPDDPRYQQYIGTSFDCLIVTGEIATMTVIADEAIKPEFGTGAMTITPAHDPIDYEIAQRHNLPIHKVIDFDGRLLPIAGDFAGMKVSEARTKVAERMMELGLIEKTDPTYTHTVGLCYKSKQLIEPMLMPQWFIKVRPLAEKAKEAVESGAVRVFPESYKGVLINWLENLRDWNISRQIAWGIPIAGAMPENPDVANDPDTFDTWFSSGQWPYAVFEAASKEGGRDYMKEFYPTSLMVTGRDLTFLWVARMLMFGLYVHGEVPFRDLYLHGMLLDPKGKKMSKSKGNVVSPLDLIAQYGTDAVRFGLLIGSSPASDSPMAEEKIKGGRNFANKVWNISRFVCMQLGEQDPSELPAPKAQTEADTKILAELARVRTETVDHFENYRFALALQGLHEFVWHQFADTYIEAAKNQEDRQNTQAILWKVLVDSLIMLHPCMSFVTEAIWQRLPGKWEKNAEGVRSILAQASWPTE